MRWRRKRPDQTPDPGSPLDTVAQVGTDGGGEHDSLGVLEAPAAVHPNAQEEPTMDETTTNPDRMPTWNEMRELVLNQGADLDATRTEPGGLARGQYERWRYGGMNYSDRPPAAEPAPPPRKPAPKVTVRVPQQARTSPPPTDPDAERRAGLELATRLRDAGIRSARWAREPHGSWGLRVDPHEEARAARLLDRIAGGERPRG